MPVVISLDINFLNFGQLKFSRFTLEIFISFNKSPRILLYMCNLEFGGSGEKSYMRII